MNKKFRIQERSASIANAFRGIAMVLKSEHNMWLHLFAALLAISLGLVFSISKTEWLIVVVCIGVVISSELLNTAIERIVNVISPGHSDAARLIKDIAAGGVLVSAIMALVAGAIIFLPRILL